MLKSNNVFTNLTLNVHHTIFRVLTHRRRQARHVVLQCVVLFRGRTSAIPYRRLSGQPTACVLPMRS